MTLFDLVMSCDNVRTTFCVTVYVMHWDIAPRYKFTLSQFLDNTELYNDSKTFEVNHFNMKSDSMTVYIN